MAARYEKFLTLGNKHEAEKYLLTEANDTSRYLSIQYFSDNAVNPCIESTYNFIDHVVKALVTMHNDTQPLTIFHFGGDEVAHGAWINSTACGNLIHRLGLDHSDENVADMLKDHFVQRVANITSNYSLQLAGWEDGLMDVNSVPYDRSLLRNSRVYGYAWNNIWEWGGGKRAYELANAGYQVRPILKFLRVSRDCFLKFQKKDLGAFRDPQIPLFIPKEEEVEHETVFFFFLFEKTAAIHVSIIFKNDFSAKHIHRKRSMQDARMAC